MKYYLNTIQSNSSDPEPRMQTVKVGNPTFIVIFESKVYSNRTKDKGDAMEN
jgi:hypothetical protein